MHAGIEWLRADEAGGDRRLPDAERLEVKAEQKRQEADATLEHAGKSAEHPRARTERQAKRREQQLEEEMAAKEPKETRERKAASVCQRPTPGSTARAQ